MMKMMMITMVRRQNFSIIERGSCMTVIFIYIGKRKEDNGSNMDWMMIMEQGMCYWAFFIYLFIFSRSVVRPNGVGI
ncbi:hypothetical protein BDA99DRAFT_515564 [Phascolomyces articulosus]|uniref:Uncharacterized protein n=1 Tax=Phascolomyces articulosus TaxID=60185 RepID=A0AAD5JWW1_9FUNG|nr:hypothetical protein BDA99DRAFT_515564 [Phascolomyces articulosus]